MPLTGTNAERFWSLKCETRPTLTLSLKGTEPAFSQIETRRERTIYGLASTSRWTSCDRTMSVGTSSRHVPSSQFAALLRWDVFYDGEKLAISLGPLYCGPKIVGIPVPCCDPSAVELLIRHALGPVQTLACESLNSYCEGGNDHISNLSAG